MAETSLGRMTRKSPVGAFESFGNSRFISIGGWINAIIPILIVPYYSVIGGWVIKYLIEYFAGHSKSLNDCFNVLFLLYMLIVINVFSVLFKSVLSFLHYLHLVSFTPVYEMELSVYQNL